MNYSCPLPGADFISKKRFSLYSQWVVFARYSTFKIYSGGSASIWDPHLRSVCGLKQNLIGSRNSLEVWLLCQKSESRSTLKRMVRKSMLTSSVETTGIKIWIKSSVAPVCGKLVLAPETFKLCPLFFSIQTCLTNDYPANDHSIAFTIRYGS